ncbi:unnamed protein product [Phytophthora lilii]|uniref:Unnamed protein product n=1 Tax=Phytophthora lilii TaxID=2077276 RepID=A0A9W6TGX1_9STRA|nr:unnamed protein product [Phytophthora lilii]
MKTTIVELEKQYAELCERAAATKQNTESTTEIDTSFYTDQEQKHNHAKRVLDFEAISLAATQHFQGAVNVQLDTLDEDQSEEELGFHPLTEWDLTRTILDNKRDIRYVENRLLSSLEFVNLNVLDIMNKTWMNNIQLARFKTVKAETSRLQVLQQMNTNAFVFVRDVDSPCDISLFRSVFVHFLVEATKEFTSANGDSVTGIGYVLGTQSVVTDHLPHSVDQDESGRKIAWADLALTSEAYDVEEPATGERYQQCSLGRPSHGRGRASKCGGQFARSAALGDEDRRAGPQPQVPHSQLDFSMVQRAKLPKGKLRVRLRWKRKASTHFASDYSLFT